MHFLPYSIHGAHAINARPWLGCVQPYDLLSFCIQAYCNTKDALLSAILQRFYIEFWKTSQKKRRPDDRLFFASTIAVAIVDLNNETMP